VVTRHRVHEELRAVSLTPRSTAAVWNGKRTVLGVRLLPSARFGSKPATCTSPRCSGCSYRWLLVVAAVRWTLPSPAPCAPTSLGWDGHLYQGVLPRSCACWASIFSGRRCACPSRLQRPWRSVCLPFQRASFEPACSSSPATPRCPLEPRLRAAPPSPLLFVHTLILAFLDPFVTYTVHTSQTSCVL
jgi:hypothetical protein